LVADMGQVGLTEPKMSLCMRAPELGTTKKMSTAPQQLAALLGSRICHDLVSPIGAISNGVELLQMSGSAGGGPELELIHESVDNANARIRFFRIAFGMAGEDQRVSLNEVQSILGDLTRGTSTTVSWDSNTDLARIDVKLVFLLIQCMETALPWGGTIRVEQQGATWRVIGASDRLRDMEGLWATLENPASDYEVSAAEVQFLLFPTLLEPLGRHLSLRRSPSEVVAEF
jgi:histidine phosphotransferase ChpT